MSNFLFIIDTLFSTMPSFISKTLSSSLTSFISFSTLLILTSILLILVSTLLILVSILRSEERRVGKECRSGWSSYAYNGNDLHLQDGQGVTGLSQTHRR